MIGIIFYLGSKRSELLKRKSLMAYILIGLGFYFLLKEFDIPLLDHFHTWHSIIIIVGLMMLIHSFINKDVEFLFIGTIILGVGVHLLALTLFSSWPDHWAVYLLIVGLASFFKSIQTKQHFLISVVMVVIALVILLPITMPSLQWINTYDMIWPIALILIGIYLLKK